MNGKICSFCGHRTVITENLEEKVYLKLLELVEKCGYTSFYSGGMGEFDKLCESATRKLKQIYPHIKLYRVIYKYKTNMEDINNLVDEIIIPDLGSVHYKKIITLRNQWMIENSEGVLCYLYKNYGGAYQTMKYAKLKEKKLIILK